MILIEMFFFAGGRICLEQSIGRQCCYIQGFLKWFNNTDNLTELSFWSSVVVVVVVIGRFAQNSL